jgi:hypothetical protein
MSLLDEAIAFIVSSELYEIHEDGTIFTRVTPQGHVSNKWRNAVCLDRRSGRYRIRAKYQVVQVSRVIYWKFRGPIPVGLHVDHINENCADNRLENLQLLSVNENSKKSHKNNEKRLSMTRDDWVKNFRFTKDQVLDLRRKRAEGMSLAALANEYATSKGHVSDICNRRIWQHVE